MGNSNSKTYYLRPDDSHHPVDSFKSILNSENGNLWYDGFKCPGCGFYIESGVLRIRFIDQTPISEKSID